jgi:hypothetical protein
MIEAVEVCAAVQKAALEVLDVPVSGWRSAHWERDAAVAMWRGEIYGGAFDFHVQEREVETVEVASELLAATSKHLGWNEQEAEQAKLQVSITTGADGLRSWIGWQVQLPEPQQEHGL